MAYKKKIKFLIITSFCWLFPFLGHAADGDTKWTFQKGSEIAGAVAVGNDGTLYLGASGQNQIYAIKDEDDNVLEKWTFSTTGQINKTVAIGADDTLYFTTSDGKLYALKDEDDKALEKWTFSSLKNTLITSPSISNDGIIYFGASEDSNGKIYAIKDNSDDYSKKWEFPDVGSVKKIIGSPAISSDSTLYFGTSDGKLYAIKDNGDESEKKWEFDAGEEITASPVIDSDGIIYFGTSEGKLYALKDNGTEPEEKWTTPFDAGKKITASPVIDSNNVVYFGTSEGKFYAVKTSSDDNNSAEEKWVYPKTNTLSSIDYSPVIGKGGIIYFGASSTKFYALDMDDGELKWNENIDFIKSSSIIVKDGTLYLGTSTSIESDGAGRLYAIETNSAGIDHDAAWPVKNHDLRHTSRNALNKEPEADAGKDQDAVNGEKINLNASASTDPDYGIASYKWTQTDGTSVTLSDADTYQASFTTPNVDDKETLSFKVTVTDNGGKTDTDTISVTVEEDDSFCFIQSAGKDSYLRHIFIDRTRTPTY